MAALPNGGPDFSAERDGDTVASVNANHCVPADDRRARKFSPHRGDPN